MTPRELIRQTAARFESENLPDPENDASLLLSFLTGRPALNLRLDEETVLDPAVVSAFLDLSGKRLRRVPLQYLLGEVSFFTRPFKVDSRVLIPRPETELLCEWALELMARISSPRILDLCCGSGCIGLTLKAERPDAVLTLSDLSPDALKVSAENADRLSLDVEFIQSDLLDDIIGTSYDLIVSNPPYIPSAVCDNLQPEVCHEPRLALDGGLDGCDLYRRIISSAGSVLVPGGMLLMEMGISEAPVLSSLMSAHGFSDIRIRKDYAGIDRMICAVLS